MLSILRVHTCFESSTSTLVSPYQSYQSYQSYQMQQRFADKHKKLFQVDLGHNKLMTKKGTIEYANFLKVAAWLSAT